MPKWVEVGGSGGKDRKKESGGAMFFGTYQLAMDSKGRLIIPSKHRALLEHKGVQLLYSMIIGPCLALFPPAEWEELMSSLNNQPPFHSKVMNLQRLFLSQTDTCPLDRQGRVLLPQNFRQSLDGGKDVYLIGVQNRIEIWPSRAWEEFVGKASSEFQDWADQLPWQPGS